MLCLIVFGCQYQCNWLPRKTRLRNDLLCVEWDVKPYTLTHSLCNPRSTTYRSALRSRYIVFCDARSPLRSNALHCVHHLLGTASKRSDAGSPRHADPGCYQTRISSADTTLRTPVHHEWRHRPTVPRAVAPARSARWMMQKELMHSSNWEYAGLRQ